MASYTLKALLKQPRFVHSPTTTPEVSNNHVERIRPYQRRPHGHSEYQSRMWHKSGSRVVHLPLLNVLLYILLDFVTIFPCSPAVQNRADFLLGRVYHRFCGHWPIQVRQEGL